MSKEIYISSTPHETRLAIVENDALAEIYYERENEYTLAGSIYNGKVTRVLPGMQSSFVDIGLERDAFLYITDFMEEAGDSADFEGGGERAPRTEGRRDNNRRDGNRDRAPRNADLPPAEPSDADLFTSAVSSLDPARPVESERSGSRRGGRNRGGRGDRARRDNPGTPAPVPAEDADYFRPETPTLHVAPLNGAPLASESTETVGEGAPGADGSRRWRGRRGRRGGRGPGRDQARTPVVAETAAPEADSEPSYVDYDRLDIDASAAPPIVPIAPPAETQAAFTRPERSDRGGRNDRGGRGRNDRGGRNDRSDRGPRSYGAESSGDDAPAYGTEPEPPAGEPIILPGESLSKYRKGEDAPAAAAPIADANVIIPKPSTEFHLPDAWDGGLVLPGETLRRREPSAAFRNESNDRGRRNERPEPTHTLPIAAEPMAIEPIVSEVILDHSPVEHHAEPVHQEAIHHEAIHQEPTHTLPIAAEPTAIEPIISEVILDEPGPPVVDSTFVPPPPAPEQEYEPSEASASYRVDPVPPREFRQSAPAVLEPETPAEPQHTLEEIHSPEGTHGAPDQLTTISATGEMHSEAPFEGAPLATDAVPAQDLPEPTAPIYNQNAVVDTPQAFEQHPYFAPGSGVLEEEELIDEDEAEPLRSLHAATAADEQEEDETLEGAADLGTMIREMSIDQITRSGVVDDEDEDEDDFDDFLEEDQEYSLEDDGPEIDDSDIAVETEAFAHDPDFQLGLEEDGAEEGTPVAAATESRPERQGGFRRDGRRGDRSRRSGNRDRNPDRSSSSAEPARERSDRPDRPDRPDRSDRGRRDGNRDHRGGRQSMQSTNLPAISDLLKPGQELLCQIAKEPIARKGARITSHIALPGRFLVFMPTVSHTGVSRKIESDAERRRLKEILLSEKGEAAGGFIVRTAAAGASEEELRSDLRFLLNLWTDIKARSESSKSPALIYHDLNLVERVLRDQVTDTFSAIWVDTETEYERVLRFLQRFQPSLIRRVKLYTKETPLFEQFGITEEINKALRSKVWLKSGGSIVINQTEALVAIDINTGKFVGKTARLEDTIVKTNLDAIPEIVRQIRLRDLGGIIIIDFIDMDERKNRNRVMAALEEELKSDRAPSKVLQFNDFGLVAITRKRVKQSLERTLSTTCGVCAGTGMVKSPITVCNDIYIEMRKMHKHLDRGDVMLRVNPEVVKQLKAPGTKWLQEMEEMCGKTILVKSDPSLHPEQFDIH